MDWNLWVRFKETRWENTVFLTLKYEEDSSGHVTRRFTHSDAFGRLPEDLANDSL